jgi:phosphotriesterase-related protein
MVMVPTVRGPVDSSELGPTLMHEHVFVLTTDVQQNYPDEFDADARVADAAARLTELRGLGVTTIVDPTVVGLGRNISLIQRVNAELDLNIVVATGVYTYDTVPFYFTFRGPGVSPDLPEPMVDLFVRDLTEGIAGTGVRAGLLKCAIDQDGLRPGVERVLRAVAAAHRQTGAPVMVHTHPGTRRGLEVAALLREEGVDPGRVQLAPQRGQRRHRPPRRARRGRLPARDGPVRAGHHTVHFGSGGHGRGAGRARLRRSAGALTRRVLLL